MTRLAANLTMLFTEQPFLERFQAASQAGFRAWNSFPYAFAPEQIADQLRTHRLQLVLHNLPAGNWDAGERGIACHPDRVAEFRAGVDEAIRYARALEVPQLNCLVGILPPGVSREAAREVLVGNLRYAAALKEQGIRLLIEPINTSTFPASSSTPRARRWS
jgi:hydroxypyruvate isomerase